MKMAISFSRLLMPFAYTDKFATLVTSVFYPTDFLYSKRAVFAKRLLNRQNISSRTSLTQRNVFQKNSC